MIVLSAVDFGGFVRTIKQPSSILCRLESVSCWTSFACVRISPSSPSCASYSSKRNQEWNRCKWMRTHQKKKSRWMRMGDPGWSIMMFLRQNIGGITEGHSLMGWQFSVILIFTWFVSLSKAVSRPPAALKVSIQRSWDFWSNWRKCWRKTPGRSSRCCHSSSVEFLIETCQITGKRSRSCDRSRGGGRRQWSWKTPVERSVRIARNSAFSWVAIVDCRQSSRIVKRVLSTISSRF